MATTDDPFAGVLAGRARSTCTVPGILAQLRTDAHRQVLIEFMAKPEDEVPSSRIERALRAQHVQVSRPKIEAHRAGRCDCP